MSLSTLFSVGANAKHGLRRSNADKRRAVLALLNDDEWSQWSDRMIAEKCLVGHSFVSNMRNESGVHGGHLDRKGADGKTYPVPPKPAPELDACEGCGAQVKTRGLSMISKKWLCQNCILEELKQNTVQPPALTIPPAKPPAPAAPVVEYHYATPAYCPNCDEELDDWLEKWYGPPYRSVQRWICPKCQMAVPDGQMRRHKPAPAPVAPATPDPVEEETDAYLNSIIGEELPPGEPIDASLLDTAGDFLARLEDVLHFIHRNPGAMLSALKAARPQSEWAIEIEEIICEIGEDLEEESHVNATTA